MTTEPPPSPLLFGDSRPTAHVTNHTTFGRASLGSQKSSEEKTARDLLRDVQEDDEMETGRRRSGALKMFGRRSPSLQEIPQGDDPINKHYVKMGILMSEEGQPRVTQSLSSESKFSTGPTQKRTHTLPSSSPRTRPLFTVEGDREGDKKSVPEGARPVSRSRTNSSGFELVDVEPCEEERGMVAQPSPPISVKSSSSNNTVNGVDELVTSSPDSGYGNTPEYINAARSTDSEGRGHQQPSGATNESTPQNRVRGETESRDVVMRSRGEGPHRGGSVERSPLKHAHTVPSNLAAMNHPPMSLPETVPEGGAPFPFHMSLASGRPSVNGVETGSVVNFSEMERQLERRAHHHVNPLQPTPQRKIANSFPVSQGTTVDPLRRGKMRAASQPFSAVSDVQAVRQVKSGTVPASPPESKDYFQVTDELSKENSHFSLSEALLSVIEQTADLRQTTRRSSQPLSLLELMQSPSWDNSAESTAQKLLRHMTGHMTKTNSNDSQVVVQVPTEFLASLQRDEDLQKSVTTSSAHMRGNREWAPPRKQIIYSIKQPSRNLQKDLAAQGYRCTGCGMKVNPGYVKYFRFCNYTGKYFCQNCHMNATSLIPAYILERWSFKRLSVSNFARDLLVKIYSEPLFTISSSTVSIYSKSPLMAQARDLRSQLISVKQYLNTCRSDFAQQLNLSFQGYAPWTVDLHTYSIEDFVEVKSGTRMKYLRAMLADGIAHIKSCPLCMGKGFVCELCSDQDIIFPFESSKVSTCRDCQCCFHKACFSPTSQCPRCHRMHLRLKQRAKAAEGNRSPSKDYSDRPS